MVSVGTVIETVGGVRSALATSPVCVNILFAGALNENEPFVTLRLASLKKFLVGSVALVQKCSKVLILGRFNNVPVYEIDPEEVLVPTRVTRPLG